HLGKGLVRLRRVVRFAGKCRRIEVTDQLQEPVHLGAQGMILALTREQPLGQTPDPYFHQDNAAGRDQNLGAEFLAKEHSSQNNQNPQDRHARIKAATPSTEASAGGRWGHGDGGDGRVLCQCSQNTGHTPKIWKALLSLSVIVLLSLRGESGTAGKPSKR